MREFLRKSFAIFASFAFILQSLTPFVALAPQIAYAQEVTPTDTATPTPTDTTAPTPAPTDTATVTPTDTVTPTPTTQQISVTPSDTPTITDSPTPVVTDTPTPTTDQASPTATDTNTNPSQAPPTTVTPTGTTDTTSDTGSLSTTVLNHVSAPSLDLSSSNDQSATLSTDKADYAPTDTALISGSGFKANKSYNLEITSSDAPAVDFIIGITTDNNGSFAYAYQLDGNYRPNYTVYVKLGDHIVATTTFTDSSVGAYNQCSNDQGTGYSNGDTGCRWINGDLQHNNSRYFEGDATPQRVFLTGLSNGTHTVTFQYDVMKNQAGSPKHAYDYLTNYNDSENWIAQTDLCDNANTNGFGSVSNCSNAAVNTFTVPTTNVCGSNAGSPHGSVGIKNGTITAISNPTIATGDCSGDTDAAITVTFSVNTSTCINSTGSACAVEIFFGGHISRQADYGNGNTAVNISGSPYHVSLAGVDGGSVGQMDNQLQAAAVIPPSTLTINKTAVGGNSTFAYTTTETNGGANLSGSFNITTANGTGSASFTTLTPGTYTVSETAPSNGWSFTNLVCSSTDTSKGTVTTSGSTATVTVGLSGGATITCTYTNTLQGTIELKKAWVGTAGQTTLNIGTSAGGTQIASVTTGAAGAAPLTTGAQGVSNGTYYISESGGLTDYTATLACTDNGNAVTPGDNNSLTVAPGHAVVCTFTNTRDTGTIEVKKVVDPSSDTGTFNLQVDGTTDATGGDGTTTGAVSVDTGSHSVAETGANGTDLSNYTSTYACTVNGNASVSGTGTSVTGLSVAKGDAVVCTFTNTLKRGTIIVKKTMVGGTGSFTFTGDIAGTIATDGSTLQTTVLPGTYTSTEQATSGWDLTGLSCDDTDSTGSMANATATFKVAAGETVTCTFTNTKKGHLIVHKAVNTVQSQNDTLFNVTATGSGTITENAAEQISVNSPFDYEVTPGTYFVSETVPTGWSQTDNTCSNVSVAAGETKECTITNTQLGSIYVLKYDDLNANGAKDSSAEAALSGWDVTVNTLGTKTTDNTGYVSFSDVTPGSYIMSETLQNDWYQSDIACTGDTGIDNDNSHDFTVNPGQTVWCEIGNYQKAHVIVTKDVVDPDGNPITDTSTLFTFNLGTDSASLTDGDSHEFVIDPGVFSLTETPDKKYDFGDCTSTDDPLSGGLSPLTDGYSSIVTSGQTIHITCTNKQKQATITVVKNVVAADGSTDVADTHTFQVTLNGQTKDFGEGNNATFNVNPGTYSASESAETNYTLLSNDGPATVTSGGTATITIVNKQNPGSISGNKTDATSGDGIANWVINLYTCQANFLNCVLSATTSTDTSGNYTFDNLISGYYQVQEFLDSAWTAVGNLFYNVEIDPGTVSTDNNFVNFKNFSVTACKKEDADGSLTTTNDQSDVAGWTVNLVTDAGTNTETTDTQTTGRNGCYTWTNLGPNHSYSVTESMQSGWQALSATSFPVTVTSGNDQTFTFVNFHLVGISGYKFSDNNGNGSWDQGELGLAGWTIKLEDTNGNVLATTTTGADGAYSFTNLAPGTYRVREAGQTGWVQKTTDPADITVSSGQNVTDVNFGNQENGTIIVHKMADTTGNGTFSTIDDDANTLGFRWGYDATASANNTNLFGASNSVSVVPGDYDIYENSVSGYKFVGWIPGDATDNPYYCGDLENTTLPATLTVSAGQSTEVTLCNQQQIPVLTITKTNDKLGQDLNPGDSVLYTLTITATQAAAQDVTVTDLLPKGFKYRSGSYTATSNIHGTLSIPEPTYHSPGTWTLGNMDKDETITMTLIADIDSAEHPGTYKDVAYGRGQSLGGEEVAASAGTLGNIADPNFVGTEVTVVKNQQDNPTINVINKQEVLGAATYLPDTGANSLWVIIGGLMTVSGIMSIGFGIIMKKKYE